MPLPEEVQNEVIAKQQISVGKKTGHKIAGIGSQGLYIETEIWIMLPLPTADPDDALKITNSVNEKLTTLLVNAVEDAQQKARVLAPDFAGELSYDHDGARVKITPALPEKGSSASKTTYTPPPVPKTATPELTPIPTQVAPPIPYDPPRPSNSDGSNFDPAFKLDRTPKAAERKPGQWWYDKAVRFTMRGEMMDFFVANPKVQGSIGSIKKEVYESMGLPSLNQMSESNPLRLTLQVVNKKMEDGPGKGNYRVNIVGAHYMTNDPSPVQPEAEEDRPF